MNWKMHEGNFCHITSLASFRQSLNSIWYGVFYRQLTALIDMYTSTEISEHLLPITLSLAEDKVAEVRHMAFRVVSRRSLIIGSLTRGEGVVTWRSEWWVDAAVRFPQRFLQQTRFLELFRIVKIRCPVIPIRFWRSLRFYYQKIIKLLDRNKEVLW